jgi:hypothetical protein
MKILKNKHIFLLLFFTIFFKESFTKLDFGESYLKNIQK